MKTDAGKKALLVVSFGTSFGRTREKTIDQIEKDLAAAFPDYQMYRAWTSTIIIAKILRRDGVKRWSRCLRTESARFWYSPPIW